MMHARMRTSTQVIFELARKNTPYACIGIHLQGTGRDSLPPPLPSPPSGPLLLPSPHLCPPILLSH